MLLSLEHLAELLEEHREAAAVKVREFQVGSRFFAFNAEPAIMGVINLSPESWYRESVCLTVDKAVERGKVLQAQGAAMIDVGAESTLAYAARVDAAGQQSQLLPVVKGLAAGGVIVSVETYRKEVARASLEAGAKVINLTGMEDAPEIFAMAAAHEAAVVICYVQGRNVREVGEFDLENIVPAMHEYFSRQTEIAGQCGLERIFIDPGLGFYYRNLQDGKMRVKHQIDLFLNTFRLRAIGFPVCHALPHAFEYFGEEVRCAEPFFAVLAALGKTDLFRTHEVPRIKAVLGAFFAA
jgi:dihydropteroate synthase